MKVTILCLIGFLLMTFNTFSQVAQKKQTTAPVIQKAELKKANVSQPKAVVINPAQNQFVKPKDTANAKLTEVTIDMVYETPWTSSTNSNPLGDLKDNSKPQIDLFAIGDNQIAHQVAHWDFNDGFQNQKMIGADLHTILLLKIPDNTAASFLSFRNADLKIRFAGFYKGDGAYGAGGASFSISKSLLTLKFLNPSFNMKIDLTDEHYNYEVWQSDQYFSCINSSYVRYNDFRRN